MEQILGGMFEQEWVSGLGLTARRRSEAGPGLVYGCGLDVPVAELNVFSDEGLPSAQADRHTLGRRALPFATWEKGILLSDGGGDALRRENDHSGWSD